MRQLCVRHTSPFVQGLVLGPGWRPLVWPQIHQEHWRLLHASKVRLANVKPTRPPPQPNTTSRPLPRPAASPSAPAGPNRRPPETPPPPRSTARPGQSRRDQEDAKAPPSPPEKATLENIYRQRKIPLVGVGLSALGLGLYVALLINSYIKTPDPSPCTCGPLMAEAGPGGSTVTPLPTPTGRPTQQSPTDFDADLAWPEWLMGITKLRRRLAATARGHVLETAVGTGRNAAFYDWDAVVAADDETRERERERSRVRRLLERNSWGGLREREKGAAAEGEVLSFTGVDVSGEMLEVARTKLRKHVPGVKKLLKKRRKTEQDGAGAATPDEGAAVVDLFDGRLRLLQLDAQQELPPPPAPPGEAKGSPAKYDTVVQTFGLCSVSDPAGLLANMAARVKPGTGRIILLEHGRGSYGFVNNFLDRNADRHFARYSCWWNRDIEAIVRDAAASVPGLQVVKLERPYLTQAGTTLWIELKVEPAPVQTAAKPA